MIVVMEPNATDAQIVAVVDRLVNLGFDIHRSTGAQYTLLGAVGSRLVDTRELELLNGVDKVVRVSSPYKLAARAFKPDGTQIKLDGVTIGGEQVVLFGGPGVIESREQLATIAEVLAKQAGHILCGNAFRASNDPFGFQGLGEEGLRLLRASADEHKLLVLSEVNDGAQLEAVTRYADLIQIAAGQMQNFPLLRAVAKCGKPIVLTRNASATIEETLLAADFLMTSSNHDIVICESGIKTFETYTRHTLDLSAIPVIKKLSHLPVLVDPNNGTGRRDKVAPMARAAVAAGADGLLLQLHPEPERALCDGAQALPLEQLPALTKQLATIASALERGLQ
jgi:3-deoxy-7-phosphoheptulonate synthase